MINVIPYPAETVKKQGVFSMPENVYISADSPAKFNIVSDILSKKYNVLPSETSPTVRVVSDASLPPEGYVLDIEKDRVTVTAASDAGVLYATSTLRQLIGLDLPRPLQCECMRIKDAPLYSYRGMMLDISRHFFDKNTIKSIIDMLAYHKMNKLHLHLTDDNGWRIEIKKYPLLTEIGSRRNGSHTGSWNFPIYDETPYSGFLSQDDVRELVAYAEKLNVEIIPEIDMPAHFRAAIAAYPHLACREEKRPVPWYYATPQAIPDSAKNYARIACAGKESTFRFIFDVIDELTELFPSKYFHIGGDEAPKDEWKKCPHCRARIESEGLKNEEDLQFYFNKRVSDYLKSKGKTLICWNDALHSESHADRSIVCQYYTAGRDISAEKHLSDGGKVIISRFKGFYFDMCYKEVSLKNAYKYKVLQDGINENNAKNVLGVECTLWTEWIPDKEKLDFQMYPRLEACAEQGWCTKKTSYGNFLARLKNFLPVLSGFGIYYARDFIVNAPFIIKEKRRKIWYAKNTQVEFEYQKRRLSTDAERQNP